MSLGPELVYRGEDDDVVVEMVGVEQVPERWLHLEGRRAGQ